MVVPSFISGSNSRAKEVIFLGVRPPRPDWTRETHLTFNNNSVRFSRINPFRLFFSWFFFSFVSFKSTTKVLLQKAGNRMLHSNNATTELLLRRRLEEQQQQAVELQQAIELQSRRFMGLNFLDLKNRSFPSPNTTTTNPTPFIPNNSTITTTTTTTTTTAAGISGGHEESSPPPERGGLIQKAPIFPPYISLRNGDS